MRSRKFRPKGIGSKSKVGTPYSGPVVWLSPHACVQPCNLANPLLSGSSTLHCRSPTVVCVRGDGYTNIDNRAEETRASREIWWIRDAILARAPVFCSFVDL